MIVIIDIGNSNISLALAQSNRLMLRRYVPTRQSREALKISLRNIFKEYKNRYPSVSESILCSVVPEINIVVSKILNQEFGDDPLILGDKIHVPIANRYANPQSVGQDRLVCAFAGKRIYGSPLILIDLGTAITVDIISRDGAYEGGLIIPGIKMSLESLSSKTSLLPDINKVEVPKHLIGKNTKESILSGIFNGYGQMISGLIVSLSRQLGKDPKVVLTGGHAKKMMKFVQAKKLYVDETLVLKGLQILSHRKGDSTLAR